MEKKMEATMGLGFGYLFGDPNMKGYSLPSPRNS